MKSWVWAPSLMVQISYEMITGSVFYEVPHSQRPFIENMTVVIKIWHFFRGHFVAFSRKKGEAGASALYA